MERMMKIEVPASHVAFAEAVADLAEANGIQKFELKYTPEWEANGGERWDRAVWSGEATISFRAKDGRGRPCRNLSVGVQAYMRHDIVSTPESCG